MDYSLIAPMMGRLWSPIAAVTTLWQGVANAQIAVAIGASSIVPDQPRVAVQIYKRNYTHDLIRQSKVFALNFLRPDQLRYVKEFGLVSGREVDKLREVSYATGASGSPILQDCWGYLDCRVVNAMDGGDMTCFLGEVLDGATISESEPMWWPEARAAMPPQWRDEWDRKIQVEIDHSRERMKHIDYTPWVP
jgi:flavin reductase (DIM6/NTAB) family NADH-FMN oxidoreductase RutF